ncbi:hypothetical protein [Deminuibacter soli]|uniref:Uncharacterized protein n=1 Tax=Deminuibacter soli TaxID=2291815 RepID=A0A3E1NIL6_9BACT|nr:hypothetical protein [Deminuibacter soli]RFM27664.1 hypothetical protein DXN05_13210 [Deminuibacter soli]
MGSKNGPLPRPVFFTNYCFIFPESHLSSSDRQKLTIPDRLTVLQRSDRIIFHENLNRMAEAVHRLHLHIQEEPGLLKQHQQKNP